MVWLLAFLILFSIFALFCLAGTFPDVFAIVGTVAFIGGVWYLLGLLSYRIAEAILK